MSKMTYSVSVRPEDKPLVWLRGNILTPPFSLEARREAGVLLRQLQQGMPIGLPLSRPMPSIGVRCHELRIPDKDHNWRFVYRIESDAIVILDVFPKKTQATPHPVIEQAKARLEQYLRVIKKEDVMDRTKRAKLEAAGWAVATPKEFLELSDEDAVFIEVKVALAAALRAQRIGQAMSQVEAAKRLHSSQSRVAKMEAADRSVTLDLLLRSFLRLGGSRESVVAALAPVS